MGERRALRSVLVPLVSLLVLAPVSRASAQLLAAKDAPIAYGHHHVNATNPAEHKKFWITLGGDVIVVGTDKREIVRIPNVLIFMRDQAAKGGSKGSTADHIGLTVPNLRQTLDKAKAAGYRIGTTEEAASGYVVKDDIAYPGGAGQGLAFVFGPDDVKVELLERRDQKEPIRLHHIHFFSEQHTAMRDWYTKVFGAMQRGGGGTTPFISSDLPGVQLNFQPSTTPVAGTTGRAVDHIGFEVKNLKEFLTRLEAQGIKPSVTLRHIDALDVDIAFIVDPWGTNIELTEGLAKIQ